MVEPTSQSQPAAWWEERYSSGAIKWSGKPNDLLVGEVAAVRPAKALDLGCGTGGDAIWLASLGWEVTAVDIAQAALDQAAQHAAEAGVADRISFARHDFEGSFPDGEFDLVAACYLQSPMAFERLATLRRAATAVAPAGTLVIVSHEETPSGSGHDAATYMPTAPQLLADLALTAGDWATVRAEGFARQRTRPDGSEIHYRDNVLHLRRA